ncbi:MAG TPA: hypothetical protein VLF64_00425 [Candidatus Saccharimonadales bacterium]|nr:hypothetical protein [Candidatus Saccharimonadales bacterium]
MTEKILRSAYEVANDKYPAPDAATASAKSTPDTAPIPAQSTSPENSVPTSIDTAPVVPPSPDNLSTPDINPTTNTETFATDVEILGKHYPVHQMINEIGNQRMLAVESVSASWKNMLDTPGKMRLGLARSIAEGRLTRQQRKADAVSHLSNRNWLRRRRMNKLRKAKERFDGANDKYQGRKDRMTARRENVGKNAEQRRNEYRKELRARREAALGRRALRHELRAQDAGRLEARAVLKDIPKERLDRVGKLAATAYASERRASQARRQEKTAISRETRTLNAISDNRRRSAEAASEAKKADSIVEKLQAETIPRAEASLQSLRNNLEGLEKDDPARGNLEVQIREAEDRIAMYQQREIPYWSQVALSNRERIIRLDENHKTLTTILGHDTAAKNTAVTDTNAARTTAEAHKTELAKAATEATNSGPESNN